MLYSTNQQRGNDDFSDASENIMNPLHTLNLTFPMIVNTKSSLDISMNSYNNVKINMYH